MSAYEEQVARLHALAVLGDYCLEPADRIDEEET